MKRWDKCLNLYGDYVENKCCLYVIISIRFFSITICNLLIEFPSYVHNLTILSVSVPAVDLIENTQK